MGSPREALGPHSCPALGATHLITHVRLLSAVRLHVLRESLLHGVDTTTHGTGEGAQLWGLGRDKRGPDGEKGSRRDFTSCPHPHKQAPFPGQGTGLTGSGLFFLEEEGTGVRSLFPQAHPRPSRITRPPDPVSALNIPTPHPSPFLSECYFPIANWSSMGKR